MEKREVGLFARAMITMVTLVGLATGFFILGIWYSRSANAADQKKEPRVIYEKESSVDFEGMKLKGELRNPGEFYFKNRPEEKFDSLVKRRKNFQKEMLRDAVLSR